MYASLDIPFDSAQGKGAKKKPNSKNSALKAEFLLRKERFKKMFSARRLSGLFLP